MVGRVAAACSNFLGHLRGGRRRAHNTRRRRWLEALRARLPPLARIPHRPRSRPACSSTRAWRSRSGCSRQTFMEPQRSASSLLLRSSGVGAVGLVCYKGARQDCASQISSSGGSCYCPSLVGRFCNLGSLTRCASATQLLSQLGGAALRRERKLMIRVHLRRRQALYRRLSAHA